MAVAGCASGPAKVTPGNDLTTATTQQSTTPPSDPRAALEYHVLVGEIAVQRGQRDVAAESYVAALDYDHDPELAQRATRIALFAGNAQLGYRAALAWTEAEPGSLEAHKTAARLALRTGAQRQLALHAAAVIRLHPEGEGVGFRDLADVLSGEDNAGEVALTAIDSLVAEYPDLPGAHYAQGLLAMRYGYLGAASAAVDRALTLRPDWPDAVLLRAGVLVRQGRIDLADELVAKLPGSRDERARYHLGYARMLVEVDRVDAAADQFDQVLKLEPDDAEARFGLGVLALSLDDYERAERAFSRLYYTGHRRDDAAFYLGAIAEHRRDYLGARRWYARVRDGANLFEAEVRTAGTYYEQGDLERARTELRHLREWRPHMAEQLYLAEGELLYEAQQYGEALGLYNEALKEYTGDSNLLYARSLIAERLGNIALAEADLRSVLQNEPGDPRALNALGYMLSNHSDRYREALDYIEQALKNDPDNPVIIDSMGWVQYRLGNLEKAREYLERAYADLHDPEVAAHFGEVLWKLGQKDRAREVWAEARADDPDHPILRETVERLVR